MRQEGNMLRNNRNGRVWVNKLFFLLLAYPDRHVWRAVKQVELLETLQSVLTGYSCYWLQRAGVEAAMPILSAVLRWIEKGKASLLVGINASVLDTINWVSGTIYTHTCLTALCPGLPGWAGARKVKPVWILLEQEIVSASGISWACASLHLAPDR